MFKFMARSRIGVSALAVTICSVICATAIALPAAAAQPKAVAAASTLKTAKSALRTARSAKRLATQALAASGGQGAVGAQGSQGTAGANGTNGANGANGANGTNGTNASVPSQSASVLGDVTLAQDQFPGKRVIDLESGAVGPGAVFLAAKERGRILANATITLQETNGLAADPELMECTLMSAPTDANGNVTGTYTAMSKYPANTTLSGGAQEIQQLSLTAGKFVEAGNYDVAVYCRQISGNAPVKFTSGDLTAQIAGLSVA